MNTHPGESIYQSDQQEQNYIVELFEMSVGFDVFL